MKCDENCFFTVDFLTSFLACDIIFYVMNCRNIGRQKVLLSFFISGGDAYL